MNLHRTAHTAEWQLAAGKLNGWQRLASRTGGVITPGNVITIAGFILVLLGLVAVISDQYWLALLLLVIGRAFDLLDGYAADKTGTKSPLGEKLDAGFDKLGTLLIVIILTVTSVISWRISTLLIAPQLLIAIISAFALLRHKPLHPSRMGKISMALAWLCLIGFVALQAINGSALDVGRIIAGGLLVASISTGLYAFLDYIEAYQKRPK